VSGDVFIGGAPVLVSPYAAVGGVDREQADPMAVGLGAQPVAEHRGWETGHRHAEAFSAPAATHRLAPGGAGAGEVEVLDGDRGDAIPAGVVDESGDRVAHLSVAARRGSGQVDVDAVGSPHRVAAAVEAAHREVPIVEVHSGEGTSRSNVPLRFSTDGRQRGCPAGGQIAASSAGFSGNTVYLR
jgi:hypothetical protein